MTSVNERFIVDAAGNRIAVVLDVDEYNRLMEELEELEDLRAFDQAKAAGETAIPIEEAIGRIENKRNNQ